MTFRSTPRSAPTIVLAFACFLSLAACSGPSQSPVAAVPEAVAQAPAGAQGQSEATAPDVQPVVYHGCRIFQPGYYNADVSQTAPDPHSSAYIASIVATDNTGFYASLDSEQVNFADAKTHQYTIKQKVPWHTFPVPEPWQDGYYIESGGDGHSIVLLVTPPQCHLYELYSTTFDHDVLSAYSGANWDLSAPYRVQDQASAMASGLSLFAGMVKHEEIATGIHHTLDFSIFTGAPCDCFTAPASSTGGLPYTGPKTQYEFPWGGLLRLRSSFDDSKFGPQSRAVTTALKRYGMYLADTSNHYTNNNAFYFANPTDGGAWDQSDLNALNSLRFTDFEVMPVGKLHH